MKQTDVKGFARQYRVHIILLSVLILVMLVFCIFFYKQNSARITVSQDTQNPKLVVSIDKPKRWSEGGGSLNTGAEYDFVISNLTGAPVDYWNMDVVVDPGTVIDSSWAGLYNIEDNVIHVEAVDYNIDIPPHSEVTFGFVLHTHGDMPITDYTLTYSTKAVLTDNPVFYVLLISIFIVATILVTGLVNYNKYLLLQRRNRDTQRVLEQSFETFTRIIDAKDTYTEGHSRRVAYYSREIAKRIGLDEAAQEQIYYIAMLHDIGKIGVPDVILNKPNRLDESEFDVIKSHAEVGGEILRDFTGLPGASDGARHHHERYDGMGYPDRLKGENIPLAARIICVADSFDAMSSDRIYRKKLDLERIRMEFINCSGTQFDPKLVPVMVNMISEGLVPVNLDDLESEE